MSKIRLFDERHYVCHTCGVLVDAAEGQSYPLILLKPHLIPCPLCGTKTLKRMVSKYIRKMIEGKDG